MNAFLHMRMEDMRVSHVAHGDYEYTQRTFVGRRDSDQSRICIYEVPPGKSAYPYHYHHKNEEVFYILSGEGLLRTPAGERRVAAGELLFFPTGPEGAHKITNSSETEMLTYIDFDVVHDIDIAVYPDSDKIGIWGKGINKIYPQDGNVDYYDGE